MTSSQPKVFITGVEGFTGKHLRSALHAHGYKVYGLLDDALDQEVDINNVTELKSLIKKIKPDYVIHLAAIAFVAHNNIDDFYQTNLLGTLNLLKTIHEANITPKKIIIASSANVYGNPKKEEPISEDTPLSPINHYSNSKVAMENMVKLWFNELPIIITRPFNYTGPGQSSHFLVPKIVDHFRQEKKIIPLGNRDIIRDISDVHFVIEAYIRLLEHSIHSEIFNICSNKGYSIPDILDCMKKIAGYDIQIETKNELIRDNEIKKLIGSNQKLFSVVGNIRIPPISETLENMYRIKN